MKLLLDTADTAKIEEVLEYLPVDGFTTNPTILARESKNVKETLTRLIQLAQGQRSIHAQVTAVLAEDIADQAVELRQFVGDNFYAKIPMTAQGIKAVTLCKARGVNVTVTACFTPVQALMGALAGADYIAPYVDRLDNITSNGVGVVREIVELFKIHGLKTRVLAASFKNVQQVYNVASMGAHAATVGPDLCLKLLFHPYTDKFLEDFDMDWRGRFGSAEITDLIK
jgi:fructose-6-phosphate aldolase 2